MGRNKSDSWNMAAVRPEGHKRRERLEMKLTPNARASF